MSELIGQIDNDLKTQYEIRDDANSEIKRLEKARKALTSETSGRHTRSFEGEKSYDPEKAAGEENINKVAEYVKFRSPVRQDDIAKDLGLNSGTVSCALQVLEFPEFKRKQVKRTGRTVNRSREWEWVGKPKTVKKERTKRQARSKGRAKATA